MQRVRITVGDQVFTAHWERELSRQTCAAFEAILPFAQKIIHARWSGQACWIPLGNFDLGVEPENPVSHPQPGQLLFYPAGISETEILLPYGAARFSSVAGDLAGNRILTITEGLDRLATLGEQILWHGSRDILFEAVA
ncbi:MAG: DUF3830 family protein [Gammaproteobacteria bacterium]